MDMRGEYAIYFLSNIKWGVLEIKNKIARVLVHFIQIGPTTPFEIYTCLPRTDQRNKSAQFRAVQSYVICNLECRLAVFKA